MKAKAPVKKELPDLFTVGPSYLYCERCCRVITPRKEDRLVDIIREAEGHVRVMH